ncbi:MAG: sulfotransferase [Caulobacteraceae bacterium]|nr:sulfotransferase [Caulobacteraceae bacterium]
MVIAPPRHERPAGPTSPPERLAAVDTAMRLAATGRPAEAGRRLVALTGACRGDPAAREALARALYHARRFAEAAALVRETGAGDIGALSGLAASQVALGELKAAEETFDRLVALYPNDGAAWCNRATLRRWRDGDNHIEALEAALARAGAESEIPVRYGLAKELEDVGRHAESFAHLSRGAALRRARLSYRVEMDVEAMAAITQAFDAARLAGAPDARADQPGPIFVLGLPRSGTTLVDRILSSHSQVTSLGEIPDLAMALMETTPRAGDRGAFIRAAAAIDPARLARRLADRLAGHEADRPFLIDKTPVNFLYVGLIALALPSARIVHVRRDPMDVGYALYKTLFQTGCPYSYDLTDIGRYIAAYRRLTDHWRRALPGRMIEVDYEAVVDDLEGEARPLVGACGLGWEDACLAFHLNGQPTSTASAAQVRRPLYRDSVGLWRAYAAQLEPLRQTLVREGVL